MTSMTILLTSIGIECAAHCLARVRLAYYASPISYAAQIDFEANLRSLEGLRALPYWQVHLALECRIRATGCPA